MRKLKLQMQVSLDGFAADMDNKPVFPNWDDALRNHSISNLDDVDCIILGRKTAEGFIPYWASIPEGNPDYNIARRITQIPKVVFSNTLANSEWPDTTLAKGDISEEINRLKKQAGKDIIVYGGVSFVSSLIEQGLIDEYYLFVNPVALGKGLPIFSGLKSKFNLALVNCRQFNFGKVLLVYKPV